MTGTTQGKIRVLIADDQPPEWISRELLAQLCMTMPLPVTGEVEEYGHERRKIDAPPRQRRRLGAQIQSAKAKNS